MVSAVAPLTGPRRSGESQRLSLVTVFLKGRGMVAGSLGGQFRFQRCRENILHRQYPLLMPKRLHPAMLFTCNQVFLHGCNGRATFVDWSKQSGQIIATTD